MIYQANECCVFNKTKERFGELSNMSAGYILNVNGISIRTSEALYQACRFPSVPEVQKNIIAEASPMAAKMVAKPFRNAHTRQDWDEVRVDIMRWCLRIKLALYFGNFSKVLRSTGKKNIVEKSHKDRFWGATENKENPNILEGDNMLGKLLTELRDDIYNSDNLSKFLTVEPLDIPDFLLYGEKIGKVIGKIS